MTQQRTVRRSVGIEGVGLHSGIETRVEIGPAPVNHGLLFVRRDLGGKEIPASPDAIGDSSLATTLGRDGESIATVEHLLAALHGLGVDNARIEVDGPEIPILDGSAAPFVEAIRRVGTTAQNAARRPVTVRRPLTVRDGERAILALPSRDFRISYAIDFPHPAIGYQAVALALDEEVFAASIAPARTFCLLRDVQAMRASGRARGGSLDNAVVVGEEGIVGGSLRFRDEFVRHKVLDLIGDLALLGAPLQAHIVVFKGGHRLHAQLVRRLRSGAVEAASSVSPHPPQWYDRFSHLGEQLVPSPSVLTA
jgi:UDP-3-O-[3-hydroxymyristoyl] N-acetylglucosamine deacetylase